MKKIMFFATVVAMSLTVAMPMQAQSRKDKKAAAKAQWEMEQKQQREEAELRHILRMDSIANAQKLAEEKAAAEEKARKEAEAKAEAQRRAEEEAAKAEAKRQAAELAAQEKDFDEPCMDAASTETSIRARGIGESLKHQAARTKAQTMALRDLASKVKVSVKSVLKMYTNDESTDMMTDDDVASGMYNEEKMENMVKQVVNQNLSFSTPCEKTRTYMKGNAKVFKTYMVVQAGKDEILKPLYDDIQKDNRMHLNIGYNKFKEEFEKEFEKESEKDNY